MEIHKFSLRDEGNSYITESRDGMTNLFYNSVLNERYTGPKASVLRKISCS